MKAPRKVHRFGWSDALCFVSLAACSVWACYLDKPIVAAMLGAAGWLVAGVFFYYGVMMLREWGEALGLVDPVTGVVKEREGNQGGER